MPLDLKESGRFAEHSVGMDDNDYEGKFLDKCMEACAWINKLYLEKQYAWGSETRVLIHCTQGISRSASTVIGYLMLYRDMDLRTAYHFVKSRRPIVDPRDNFIVELGKLEKRLGYGDANTPPSLVPSDIERRGQFVDTDPNSINVKVFASNRADQAADAK